MQQQAKAKGGANEEDKRETFEVRFLSQKLNTSDLRRPRITKGLIAFDVRFVRRA